MTYKPKELLDYFDTHSISYELHEHPPVFTVEESQNIKDNIPGGHSKNLFLKDKKGNLALFSAQADAQIDLKALSREMELGRFSFGKPELLKDKLGVTPGSVTAFALINDPEKEVKFALHKTLADYDVLNFHPLDNSMTVSISFDDFKAFLESIGRSLDIIDL